MNSTKPRGDVLPRRIQVSGTRSWVGMMGLTLCFGLWACGGTAPGNEEAASDKAPPANAEVASTPSAPAPAPAPAPAEAPAPAQDSDLHKERGTSNEGHLVLTGDYKYDQAAFVTCAYFPNGTLQISLGLHDSPNVVLVLDKLHGSGDYDAESRLRATYTGQGERQSRGPAKAKIEITPPTEDDPRSGIAGSFEGTFAGEAGKGTITGTFENCFYELPKSNG
jgi:hypothetical protein